MSQRRRVLKSLSPIWRWYLAILTCTALGWVAAIFSDTLSWAMLGVELLCVVGFLHAAWRWWVERGGQSGLWVDPGLTTATTAYVEGVLTRARTYSEADVIELLMAARRAGPFLEGSGAELREWAQTCLATFNAVPISARDFEPPLSEDELRRVEAIEEILQRRLAPFGSHDWRELAEACLTAAEVGF